MGVEGQNCIEQEIEKMFENELSLKGRAFSNYIALKEVCRREIDFGCGIKLDFQYNPGRKASVMAKAAEETLKRLPCFLCPSGLSPEQLTYNWHSATGKGYLIRVNPFPIFFNHYTISADYHTRQEIAGRYADMLQLAGELGRYVIFYNGPKCGASAPDHFHFQAFPKGHLPIESLVGREDLRNMLKEEGPAGAQLFELSGYLRGAYVIKSGSSAAMLQIFEYLYSLGKMHPNEWEPRMNIISWREQESNSNAGVGAYTTVLFFREESRPKCFWGSEGEERVYISPASVEMSGVVMTSSRETFENLGGEKIREILNEVSLEGSYADAINNKIREL